MDQTNKGLAIYYLLVWSLAMEISVVCAGQGKYDVDKNGCLVKRKRDCPRCTGAFKPAMKTGALPLCLLFVENSSKPNFDEAAAACRTQGGYLASIHSDGERDAMIGFIRSELGITAADPVPTTWFGLKNNVWIDQTPRDYALEINENGNAGECLKAKDIGAVASIVEFRLSTCANGKMNYLCRQKVGFT